APCAPPRQTSTASVLKPTRITASERTRGGREPRRRSGGRSPCGTCNRAACRPPGQASALFSAVPRRRRRCARTWCAPCAGWRRGGERAGDVALRRLRIHQVAGVVALDDFLVAVEDELELLAHRVVPAARGDQLLDPGELGGFAEHQRDAVRVELVESIAHGRIRAAAGGRVGLAALG